MCTGEGPGRCGVAAGGEVVSEEVGLKLELVGLDTLGSARRIVVDKDASFRRAA